MVEAGGPMLSLPWINMSIRFSQAAWRTWERTGSRCLVSKRDEISQASFSTSPLIFPPLTSGCHETENMTM